MVMRQGERLAQFRPPVGHGLVRPCIDQVEGDAAEQRLGQFQRGNRLGRRMLPPEPAQGVFAQALDAHRDAVDPGVTKRREAGGLDAGGVGLQGDFEVGQRHEQPSGIGDQVGHGLRVHQAGGAAAEEDRGQLARSQAGGLPRQFGAQGGGKAALVDAVADMGVEVAIRALGQAERPVDVQRERFHQRGKHAFTKRAKARARWLVACFSPWSISP